MEKIATTLICSLFVVLLLISSPPSLAQEPDAEDEGEFSYDEISGNGPSHWGDIRPQWLTCKNGTLQSPIALHHATAVVTAGQLQTSYRPSTATLRYTGHYISLDWASGAGYLEINGTQYKLQECHWHSPSEHTINGIKYDLEIHLVHQSGPGQTAVIGILYKIGPEDAFLTSLMNDLRALHNKRGAERAVGYVHPNRIEGIQHQQYFRYMGSLTTPPCDENVVWTVIKMERTASREQVNMLQVDKSGANARPLQPLNNRLVQLHKSTVTNG